jgi:hypothetical protein
MAPGSREERIPSLPSLTFPGPVFILMLKGTADVRHKCMDFVSGA